ncbi:MAG: hypothetical protein K0R09_2094 [Clostridiales bacterium]|jgi:uncharacterized RDD family membrane protein YckC|nr:hypothetical protein [Clostridiales bacterium]
MQIESQNIATPAKILNRIFAFFIDSIIVYLLVLLIKEFFSLENVSNSTMSQIKNDINTSLFFAFYSIIFSSFIFKGQTIGKKIMHIIIVKEQNDKIDFLTLLNREILGKIFIERINLWILLILSNTNLLENITSKGNNPLFLVVWYIISLPLVMFVSFVMMLHTKEHLTIHDRISKTKVVSYTIKE